MMMKNKNIQKNNNKTVILLLLYLKIKSLLSHTVHTFICCKLRKAMAVLGMLLAAVVCDRIY
jgi:hypothetical protein